MVLSSGGAFNPLRGEDEPPTVNGSTHDMNYNRQSRCQQWPGSSISWGIFTKTGEKYPFLTAFSYGKYLPRAYAEKQNHSAPVFHEMWGFGVPPACFSLFQM